MGKEMEGEGKGKGEREREGRGGREGEGRLASHTFFRPCEVFTMNCHEDSSCLLQEQVLTGADDVYSL